MRLKSKIQKKYKIIIIVFITILCILFGVAKTRQSITNISNIGQKQNYSTISVNNSEYEKQQLKVLVLEINPLLTSITDTNLYKNNSGHPKASEYLGFKTVAPNEMEEDIEYASHGYLDVEIVKTEWLNEFPQYTNNDAKIKSTGEYKNKLDEETFIDMFESDSNRNVGDYFKGISSEVFKEIEGKYDFDYEYIIEKFDLINRRNNGEFDQVWLNAIDPTNCYETIMIGKNPYWINGTPIEKECKNFIMLYINIARRDGCLHSLGHASEDILSYAFEGMRNEYKQDAVDASDIEKLNLWRRFTLNNWNSSSGNNGVGDVHFPFNAERDYDYENTTKVYTGWKDWQNNYPNLTGEMLLDNSDAWLKNEDNLALGDDECKDPTRLYMRFWFSLFPHVTGYYSDGYLNNWWKYIYSLDYVKNIKNNDSLNKNVHVGEKIGINLTLNYQSGESKNIVDIVQGENIKIENNNIVEYKDGILYAKNSGNTKIELFYDGKSITYEVTINQNKITSTQYTVNEEKQTVNGIKPETTVADLKKKINNEMEYIIKDKNNNTVQDTSNVGTGYKIVMQDGKEYKLAVSGDINGDGKISIIDVARLQKIAAGIITASDIETLAGDFNKDNKISIIDLAKIQKFATGKNIF